MRQLWRTVITLTFVASLTTTAEGAGLDAAERQLAEILQPFSSRFIKNPMFFCYNLGGLQSFRDLLSVKSHKISTMTGQPEQQAALLERAQQIQGKVDNILRERTYDCDPDFPRSDRQFTSDEEIIDQAKAIVKRLKKVSGEEPVIRCFETGRLNIYSHRISQMLKARYKRGDRGDTKLHSLLNKAVEQVRLKAPNCSAQTEF